MTLNEAGLLSQIAGAIGVIASLIFVGLQIRDNSSAVDSPARRWVSRVHRWPYS